MQVVVIGSKGLEVIGAVVRGRPVKAHAALTELLHDVATRWCAFKYQVLQQMRHAGLAIVFVPAANEVGDIDGGRGLGRIGCQQNPQAVWQAVFAHAFDLGVQLR